MRNTVQIFGVVVQDAAELPLPLNPMVYISVNRWSEKRDNDTPLLSPDLRSDGEIDATVNELIRDLESVRLLAKSRLRQANAKAKAAYEAKKG